MDLVLAPVIGLGPRLRWSRTTGNPMASVVHHVESPATPEPPWVRLEPVRFRNALLDGCWWPSTNDLESELRVLVPILDQVRGRIAKVLVSAVGWTARPHTIVAAGRTVAVAYLAGQSPVIMTVLCADGGTFTLRVAPPGPAPDLSKGTACGWDEDAWRTTAGGFGPLSDRPVR
ncbi:DUF5994 family protein [Actinoplanes sp. NPDC049598]|uniref:DUF5994 family protein n=1 Tax=Actinoplanes sp. NPDC049598 TaxID=3154626 RepID=UPI003442E720